jgi:ribA/ribD-fused uncharacterized protein
MGPAHDKGPSGYDTRNNKEVHVSQWFCEALAKQFIAPLIEQAMYLPNGDYRIFTPGEEMVSIFDKMYIDGKEAVGFYPTGETPGLPCSKIVLFSNLLGKQDCIITGYKFLPMQQGEKLKIVLEYATVMDTENPGSSGVKCRGLGKKYIISIDDTIDYLGHQAPYRGVDVDLQELYLNSGIHVTSEGMKGNYALMQGFAGAHGNAHEWGPYLCIDKYLMDGSDNPYYVEGDPRMVSDMTDTSSYFYQWVRDNTRNIRMRKTLSRKVWNYILAANKKALDNNGKLPGVEVIETDYAVSWDSKTEDNVEVEDVDAVTIEYDVQLIVCDCWVQVEVAPPIACLGHQGMTAEQGANLAVMLNAFQTIWNQGAKRRKGVEDAVASAETHAEIEANQAPGGIFRFDPTNSAHQKLMRHLMYNVSESGIHSLRPVKEVYMLWAHIFGGAGTDTTEFWKELVDNDGVMALDVVNGKVTTEGPYNFDYFKPELGLVEHICNCILEGHKGKGFTIVTCSQQEGSSEVVTFVDPTVFLQLGAFEKRLMAANPITHAPAKMVTGAATGIVNDIHAEVLKWTTIEFWLRTGTEGILHATNSKLRGSMMAWLGVNTNQPSMTRAKGVLSRMACLEDTDIAGKICTGIGPQYENHKVRDEKGNVIGTLPVAIIHPDCMLAEGLEHGDVIALGRTPVVSLAFCVVKFSRTYGRVGYIHVSFITWAFGNNGDTDGDPCNRKRVGGINQKGKKKGQWGGMSYATAIRLNKHPLGMGGYTVVSGEDPSGHDCADFVNFKSVWTKKVLNNALIPASILAWAEAKQLSIKDMEPLVNLMLPATLLHSARKVSQHYRANVGTAYGWCSAYSAHLKEKHSFLEAVVERAMSDFHHYKVGEKVVPTLPSVAEVMDILLGGEIYDAVTPKYIEVEEIRFQSSTPGYAWLSNMFLTPIEYQGLIYTSVEAAYHAQKDPSQKDRFIILSAFEARKLGNDANSIPLRGDWDKVKDSIMAELLSIKFSDPELKAKLDATGTAELVHTSYDTYWGMDGTMGQNKLGELIMDIRGIEKTPEVDEAAVEAMHAKYPAVMELYSFKLDKARVGIPMDIVEMGQHIKVMLEASAFLWRAIYEGLGLSGYSDKAAVFFEAFSIALRKKGVVADCSIEHEDSRISTVSVGEPRPGINSMTVGEFISKYYDMSLPVANEVVAAFALYNGYRSVEQGRHIPNEENEKSVTKLEICAAIYNSCMSEWSDTSDEFLDHVILAGIFRRAGQGTTYVSIDEDTSEDTANQMIFTYAAEVWGDDLGIFYNPMLNEIVTKCVTMYNKLVTIAGIQPEDEYYM